MPDTDKAERVLMVLFFGLVFSVFSLLPGNFFAVALNFYWAKFRPIRDKLFIFLPKQENTERIT